MECNKDEAIRVRDIVELKFAKKDLVGAKKFILKAVQLYPKLDGAILLSAVLDVHIDAQVKVGIHDPELDYYGILQVKPPLDDSTIKKQYRNLSKLVHPDKNKKSMKEEADAAFKLIGEAFRALSDEETRFQHDSKRGEQFMAKESPNPTDQFADERRTKNAKESPNPSDQFADEGRTKNAKESPNPTDQYANEVNPDESDDSATNKQNQEALEKEVVALFQSIAEFLVLLLDKKTKSKHNSKRR